MSITSYNPQELAAAAAFSKQSVIFDELYDRNIITSYVRKRIRDHVEQYLAPHSQILELNAGTGTDAIYFGQQGHTIHATDISEGMQQMLQQKVASLGLQHAISNERCSFTALDTLKQKGPYDLIFSNLGGLNCTPALDKVLHTFPPLLKPGGTISLVILNRFCLWETLMAGKGKWKIAFRRFSGSKGTRAHIEGHYFRCWYYTPSYVTRALDQSFDLLSVEGLCSIVPPSYIEHFPEKHPKAYRWLTNKENKLKQQWPWKYTGDFYIISLKKRDRI